MYDLWGAPRLCKLCELCLHKDAQFQSTIYQPLHKLLVEALLASHVQSITRERTNFVLKRARKGTSGDRQDAQRRAGASLIELKQNVCVSSRQQLYRALTANRCRREIWTDTVDAPCSGPVGARERFQLIAQRVQVCLCLHRFCDCLTHTRRE